VGLRILLPTNTAAFLPEVWSNGGELFDPAFTQAMLSESATLGAYQFAYDIRQFAPGPEDAQTGTVESGRIGMWPNWDIWYLLNRDMVPFEYSIVPPPASPKSGDHFFTGNAPGYGIPKGVKHPDESWEFMKFLLSPESMTRMFLAANNTPCRKSMAGSAALWDQNPKLRDPKLMAEIAKAKEKNAKNPPKISNWAEMQKVHTEEMTLVWAGSQPLDAGVGKVNEQWNKLLKEGQVDPDTN
jgi:ABC-type glycerol-3-phosphate transport system substrate-binding protein